MVALSYAFPPLVCIVQRAFLESFGDSVKSNLTIGSVFLKNGELISDYVACLGKKPIVIRGGVRYSKSRVCGECGSFRYSAYGTPDTYLLKSSLTELMLYQEAASSGLVVNEELRNRIDKKRWKGFTIQKLPVLDEPRDGIENFPENYYYRGDGPP
jgi:hypothetical protein